MPDISVADQIAELSARISETELRIVQQQKRIENLLARGADVADAENALAVLQKTLTDLEAREARLRKR